ncbi:hypothetical protein BDC45DRAFT_525107 [Circinella umbellata]|nr:hypothetical protein BDC45DRAFT_525107 [Circinella umbellata]
MARQCYCYCYFLSMSYFLWLLLFCLFLRKTLYFWMEISMKLTIFFPDIYLYRKY